MIDYAAWLQDPAAVRVVLIEVGVQVAGLETTRYLSTRPYVTSPTDSPANQYYEPVVTTGFSFTEQIDIEGNGSLSAGDIEIANYNGERDAWLDDIWDNHNLKAWIGDPRWKRSDFQMIFNGVVATVGSKSRDTLNLSLRDKLQYLNTPITDAKVGGTGQNKDDILSLTFGEVHNVTPQLTDAVKLEYQIHDGQIESVIEVRDNGKPVSASVDTNTGRFLLTRASAGQITASVQGDKGSGVYRNTIAALVHRIVSGYGQTDSRFSTSTQLTAGRYVSGTAAPMFKTFSRASTATYVDQNKQVKIAAVDSPRVDYTNGTSELLIESTETNLLKYSGDFSNTAWLKTRCTAPVDATLAPDGVSSCNKLTNNGIVDSNGYVRQTFTADGVSTYVGSAYVKAGDITIAQLDFVNNNGTSFLSGSRTVIDLTTGVMTTKGNTYSAVYPLANGWYRIVVAGIPVAGTAELRLSLPADATAGTAGYYVWGGDVKIGATLSSYVPTAASTVTRAADVAITYNDIDAANFGSFNADHPQPVGAFADGRTNVLELCQSLAGSVGSQLVMSRLGQLRLLQLKIPGNGTPIVVTPAQMVERSLKIKSRPLVKAAVKLGFDKNWTVQEGLLTSIPDEHKRLYATEWLTATAASTQVQSAYKLNAAPIQQDTSLIRRVDAQAEAQRQLDIWSTARTLFEFEGTSDLLSTLELGCAITITNRRFGLQNGKTGIVVSLAPNWLNGHVTVGVLV